MQPPLPSSPAAPNAKTAPKEIDVTQLMGNGREIVLLHNGERYRLRITANGKLILTK